MPFLNRFLSGALLEIALSVHSQLKLILHWLMPLPCRLLYKKSKKTGDREQNIVPEGQSLFSVLYYLAYNSWPFTLLETHKLKELRWNANLSSDFSRAVTSFGMQFTAFCEIVRMVTIVTSLLWLGGWKYPGRHGTIGYNIVNSYFKLQAILLAIFN